PALFESEDYQTRRRTLEQGLSERQEEAMNALVERAHERNVVILRTPMGLAVAATREGEVIKPDEYKAMNKKDRTRIDKAMSEIQEELEAVLKEVPVIQKEHRRQVEELNFSMASAGIDARIGETFGGFEDIPAVTRYRDAVRQDMIRNVGLFLTGEDGAQAGAFPVATSKHYAEPRFRRYAVNVVVSHPPDDGKGAPVVELELPTMANLIGRIEHVSQ